MFTLFSMFKGDGGGLFERLVIPAVVDICIIFVLLVVFGPAMDNTVMSINQWTYYNMDGFVMFDDAYYLEQMNLSWANQEYQNIVNLYKDVGLPDGFISEGSEKDHAVSQHTQELTDKITECRKNNGVLSLWQQKQNGNFMEVICMDDYFTQFGLRFYDKDGKRITNFDIKANEDYLLFRKLDEYANDSGYIMVDGK